MIVVEARAGAEWVNETHEYYWKTGHAITAAAGRHRKDRRERRVVTWPAREVLWHSSMIPPSPDAAALRRAVFGGVESAVGAENYVPGPDGY